MTEEQLYKEALAQFGITAQMRVWNEETAELEEILNKWKAATPEETLGEIADATIMTRQLIWFYTRENWSAFPQPKLKNLALLRIINQVRMAISGFHRNKIPKAMFVFWLKSLHNSLVRYGKEYQPADCAIDILQLTIEQKLHYLAEMLGTRYEPTANNE